MGKLEMHKKRISDRLGGGVLREFPFRSRSRHRPLSKEEAEACPDEGRERVGSDHVGKTLVTHAHSVNYALHALHW